MKRLLLVIMLLSSLVFIGCQNVEENVEYKEEKSINAITALEVIDRVKDNDMYVFIMGNEDCYGCLVYEEQLSELKEKEDVALDYINLPKDDFKDVANLLDILEQESDSIITPATYFIVSGKVVDYVEGPLSYDEIMTGYAEYIQHIKDKTETE